MGVAVCVNLAGSHPIELPSWPPPSHRISTRALTQSSQAQTYRKHPTTSTTTTANISKQPSILSPQDFILFTWFLSVYCASLCAASFLWSPVRSSRSSVGFKELLTRGEFVRLCRRRRLLTLSFGSLLFTTRLSTLEAGMKTADKCLIESFWGKYLVCCIKTQWNLQVYDCVLKDNRVVKV